MGIQLGGLLTSALNAGLKAPVNVQVYGRDIKKSHKIAEAILDKFKGIRGVVDARIQERLDAPQINLNIDRTEFR